MKKLFALIVAICATTLAWADASGKCGEYVTYSFVSSTGTLTISGTGAMNDYSYSDAPWHYLSIKKVVINNGVTSIGDYAFYECEGLTNVTIPNSVKSIEYKAFYGCTGLTSVTIPNSVKSIGEGAFTVCSGLTSVTIPNSVTSIGLGAFSHCTGLTSINVAEDNLNYASIDGVLYSKDKKTLIKCPDGKTGSFTIPNSVTTIEKYAFLDCKSLTNINVAEDNLNYTSIDGVLYSKDKKTLITCPGGKTGSVTIPNSVTSIGSYAFLKCTGLTSVTIPNSVTSIGEGAFSGCTGLTSMTVEATNPPLCVNYYGVCLNMPDYNIPLYVPAASVDAYKAADEWKNFTNIQAIPATGVNEAAAEKSEVKKIIDRNGIIYIEKDGTRYFLNGGKVE